MTKKARKILVETLLIGAVVVGIAFVQRRFSCHEQHELIEEMDGNNCLNEDDCLRGLHSMPYADSTTTFWTDRSYHAVQTLTRLKGLHFVPLSRNEDRPYLIRVSDEGAIVFTLANRNDLSGLDGWEILPDSVLVFDVYTPRQFDVLLCRTLLGGWHMVKSATGGPSRPVFFDPGNVRVVGR